MPVWSAGLSQSPQTHTRTRAGAARGRVRAARPALVRVDRVLSADMHRASAGESQSPRAVSVVYSRRAMSVRGVLERRQLGRQSAGVGEGLAAGPVVEDGRRRPRGHSCLRQSRGENNRYG